MQNEIEKILSEKKTENGDKAYRTTGNNLVDLMFMSEYFSKHLSEVSIGSSDKEKLFSMFIRDPRFGLGKRDLGRELLKQSKCNSDEVVLSGRYDDLWHIANNEMLNKLRLELIKGNELAKKWMPRLTGKDKKIAKALCKMWNLSEKEYRKLIKTDATVEYKLSYAEKVNESELDKLFNKSNYLHPLVKEIDFEKVPSLAMNKYLNVFSNRDDIKDRFNEYVLKVEQNKAKIHTTTSNVVDAYKVVKKDVSNKASEILANKIIDQETLGVEMDAIVILDTSGSMTYGDNGTNLLDRAYALALALSQKSTYAPNQLISFSSRPRLMTIKGETLKEKYKSMYTGDCSNTNFEAVMDLLQYLKKYPEYLIVLSDMEFDSGSNQSKKRTMEIFKRHGANTKIIWWNLNDRNTTVPELDEYGNIYLSGYNLQILKLLENRFDMTTYIDKILEDYSKKINSSIDKTIK